MATIKHTQAAKANAPKAQRSASSKHAVAHLLRAREAAHLLSAREVAHLLKVRKSAFGESLGKQGVAWAEQKHGRPSSPKTAAGLDELARAGAAAVSTSGWSVVAASHCCTAKRRAWPDRSTPGLVERSAAFGEK